MDRGNDTRPARLGRGVRWLEAAPLGHDPPQLHSTALVGRGRDARDARIHIAPDKPPLFLATLNSPEVLTSPRREIRAIAVSTPAEAASSAA